MQPHQERVVKEKEELDEKLNKLNTFVDGDKIKDIDASERNRLIVQRNIMRDYSRVLGDRIAAFPA